jgi:Holliday junction resolvasome RuvABC endonuclease subunit
MIFLGIDPGMIRLGYGSVEKKKALELNKFGMIHTPRSDQKFYPFLNEGIEHITNEFPRVLMLTQPDVIYAETVPTGKLGSNSELVIASITVCKTIAFQWGIPFVDLAANTWKSKLCDDKAATKAKTRNTVFAHFPQMAEQHKALKKEQKESGDKAEGFPPDVTDAVAIAIVGSMVYEDNEAEK